MSYFDVFILGMLQGLTEFLPVSSSGHLVLAQEILRVNQPGVAFEVLLHVASLLAVVIYFRSRLWGMVLALFKPGRTRERMMIWYLALGTIPAVIAALALKDFFERAFSSPALAAAMLIATGCILLSTRFVRKGRKEISWVSAIIIGIGQALAIMPGISRSGTTISTGMWAGVDPAEAAEYSFLLSIPAILGAVVFKMDELMALDVSLGLPYLIGMITTFVFSLFAVFAVLTVIKKGRFEYFGYYCVAAGLAGLYLFL